MKKGPQRFSREKGILFTTILLLIISLSLIGCGEAVNVGSIDIGDGGSSSLMLSWTAPTTNEDGTPLTDLAGFRLYYGSRSGEYTEVITVGNFTTAEIGGFGPGTYYLAVTAYDIYGNESAFSNEIDHTFF